MENKKPSSNSSFCDFKIRSENVSRGNSFRSSRRSINSNLKDDQESEISWAKSRELNKMSKFEDKIFKFSFNIQFF